MCKSLKHKQPSIHQVLVSAAATQSQTTQTTIHAKFQHIIILEKHHFAISTPRLYGCRCKRRENKSRIQTGFMVTVEM